MILAHTPMHPARGDKLSIHGPTVLSDGLCFTVLAASDLPRTSVDDQNALRKPGVQESLIVSNFERYRRAQTRKKHEKKRQAGVVSFRAERTGLWASWQGGCRVGVSKVHSAAFAAQIR